MSAICLIDTSVFLNILSVPGRSNEAEAILETFSQYIDLGCSFILPMATIIETGNHISQNGDGRIRRETAERFCSAIRDTFSGVAPWRTMEFPSSQEVISWIDEFPAMAGKNKSPTKLGEGTSFGDLCIIKDYEKCIARAHMTEVFIWSLDADLEQYRYTPN